MKVEFSPYRLELKHTFTISGFSRRSTPMMFIKLTLNGYTGLGEASMVPYMGENHETASSFMKLIDLSWLKFPFDFDEILAYLDSKAAGNPNIKAAIDIALHDLQGKIENRPCYQYFHSDLAKMPPTSYTIGIDTADVIIKKVHAGALCKILKVKLGSENDREIINIIRSVSDKPIYVDANQGWSNRHAALNMIHWLADQGVELVEQPMAAKDPDSNAWLTERSPLPIIGDEAVQRLSDVNKAVGVYSGINLKLMKSAGMHEGHKMIKKARDLNLKVLIGCMSETSIATLAGVAMAPLCDWADLDGPFLVSNNPYKDPDFEDGKYVLTENPGLGLKEK